MDYEESQCIKPRAGDADLWIKIWEELHGLAERRTAQRRKRKYVAV